MDLLTFAVGTLVGFSLGLTGGGGAIFAVPLLVYVLGRPTREAVGISLLTVGVTACVGFVQRARRGMVEFPTGLLFAFAGMVGAPIGAWTAGHIAEPVLLGLFALLMLVIASRMWHKATVRDLSVPGECSVVSTGDTGVSSVDDNRGPTCRRDADNRLRLTSRCALLLSIVGLGSGVLAGMFGVGGGFIIVPALVMFSGMGMQRAIGTSLLVITLIGVAGTANHLLAGRELALGTAASFTVGSVAGLFGGSALSNRLAGPTLQKVFAVAIMVVAFYVIFRTVWH